MEKNKDWKERLKDLEVFSGGKTLYEELGEYGISKVEDFISHEIEEAELRGREEGYSRGFNDCQFHYLTSEEDKK